MIFSGGVTDDQGSGNKVACAMTKLKLGGVVVDTRITGHDGTYSCTAPNLVPGAM
jgi:hypothetical protein